MKYFDIIPPRQTTPQVPLNDFDKWVQDMIKEEDNASKRGCLHKNCQNCHGTGHGKLGTCVHMLSCPCPNCSPTL